MLRSILLLMFCLLPIGFTAQAQTNIEDCRVRANGFTYEVGDADFEGCLNNLYEELLDRGDAEIYGVWDQTDIYISENGEIDTAQAGSNQWTNWGSFSSDTTITSSMSMEAVFSVVEQDLSEFWSSVFAAEGGIYYDPELVLWDGYYARTGCGTVSEEMGPLYCPNDHTIYFPVNFSQWLYSMGDFAIAAAIAHEWGHSIQAQLNLLGASATIDTELQADCLAGAYAEYITNRSRLLTLEEGDVEEGAETFFTLGDPEGTEWFDPGAHGTGSEREAAFEMGVEQGYSAC